MRTNRVFLRKARALKYKQPLVNNPVVFQDRVRSNVSHLVALKALQSSLGNFSDG